MASIEKVLSYSEKNIRTLFDNIPVPTYLWQKLGESFKLTDYNSAAYNISRGGVKNYLGIDASEMYGARKDIIEDLNRCLDRKTTLTREIKYYFDSLKEERDLLVKYVFLPPDMVLVHTEDVTEYKNVEKKIQYQARLIENVSDAIVSTDLDFNIISWNKAAELIYGWQAEEVIGKNVMDTITVEYPHDDQEVVLKQFSEEGFWKGEVIQPQKDGTPINVLTSVSMIKDKSGKPIGAVAINRNISERKKVEEELSHERNLTQLLLGNHPDFIFFKDEEARFQLVSKRFCDFFGKEMEDIIGKTDLELFPEEIARQTFEEDLQVIKTGIPLINHEEFANDTWVLTTKLPWIDKEGNNRGLFGISRDITERKLAEQKLRESEEKFREIAEQSFMAISIIQDGVFKYINARMAEVNGYSMDEIKNWKSNEFAKIIHPDDREFVMEQARKKQAGDPDVINQYPFRIIKKDGEIRWLEIYSKTINYEGSPANLTMSIDITDKVKAENELKESEEKYRSLFNNMNAGFAYHELIVDEENKPIDYKYIEANPAFEKLTGLKARDIIGKKVTEVLPGTENDPADWIGKFGSIGLTGIPLTIEDYSEAINRWYKVSGYSPKKGYFAVTFTDITERKKAEKKLKESEKKFRTIFEAIPDLYFLVSEDTTILDYKGKEQELYVSPEEFGGKKVVDLVPPYLGTKTVEMVKKTLRTQEPQILEYDLKMEDKVHFYEARYFYFFKNQVSIFIRDITDRKNAEQQIIDVAKFPSENPNPVLRVTKENVIYINNSGQNLLHITESSAIPKFFKDQVINAFNDKVVKTLETNFNGQIFSFNIVPILKEGYANIYGQDVTERLKSENALNTEKKFTDDILNSSVDTIFVFEPETGKAHRWNKVFSRVSGYTDKEISSMKAPDSYYSEEDLKNASVAAKIILTEGKNTVEMSLITKDGKKIPYEYTGTSFKSPDGKNLIVSVGRDMTERIKAEKKLKESEKNYREAFERASFYKDLFAHDINNILQVITSSAELISYQLDDSEEFQDTHNVARIIRKHVQKGAKLVKNVRTLSELDDSESLIEPIEGMSVLKNSIKFIKSAYSERDINLKIDTFANMFSVHANELLQEIFDNILINAIKYNENSPVDIQVKITKEKGENEKKYIKMEFLDNGIGIQDNKKKVLFKEGYRHLKGSKGMGVGLSLISKILKSYDGKILVEDKVKGNYKKGSNFIVLLPEVN